MHFQSRILTVLITKQGTLVVVLLELEQRRRIPVCGVLKTKLLSDFTGCLNYEFRRIEKITLCGIRIIEDDQNRLGFRRSCKKPLQ